MSDMPSYGQTFRLISGCLIFVSSRHETKSTLHPLLCSVFWPILLRLLCIAVQLFWFDSRYYAIYLVAIRTTNTIAGTYGN